MSTVRLIINPAASTVTDKARQKVREALAGHQVQEVETKARDHARDLAREAALDGVDAIVVLGGDGTVNEAANGLLDAGETTTALAALPGGSTNVFVRTVGLPRKPGKAAAMIAEAIERKSVRRMSIGRANGRAFLFHAGIGFDAAVVEQVERRSELKRKLGQAIFVYAAFATWFRHFDHKSPGFRITADGDTEDGGVDGSFTICLNTNPYTFLGPRPLNVAPGATGEHGLTTVTVRRLGVASLLGVFGRALGSGRGVERHRQVDVRRDCAGFLVHAYAPVPVQLDGDFIGRLDEIVLSHEAERLLLVAT